MNKTYTEKEVNKIINNYTELLLNEIEYCEMIVDYMDKESVEHHINVLEIKFTEKWKDKTLPEILKEWQKLIDYN